VAAAHQEDQTDARQRRQEDGDVHKRRHHEPDRRQHFENADALNLGVAEVLDPGHLAGQREAWPGQLHAPRRQEGERQEQLDYPERDIHFSR